MGLEQHRSVDTDSGGGHRSSPAEAESPHGRDAVGAHAGVGVGAGAGMGMGVGMGTRLVITEMVLENFKSYAGVQRVGPFHKCFSSVVGPNGSGKSNVIDAMLFVFGKRAKQLRLNKVSELIHNSTNFQNLEFARVSVHFQEIVDLEGEDFEVVPDSQFVVTRVAYRNNSSKYFVDDAASTFTEVTKLLRTKGIDLDNNRFLILQGEVEQIAMMKPKGQGPHDEGLLEYLEDIIGTNKYMEKIQEGATMLEQLNEKRSGLVQRLKVAEKDKESLEEAKMEAEKYLMKEAEVAKWSRALCAVCLRDARGSKQKLQEKVQQLQDKLEAERESSKSLCEELETLLKVADEKGSEYERARGELEAAQELFRSFERKDVKLKEELKHAKTSIKKLDDRIARDKGKLQESEEASETATEMLPKLEKEAAELAERLASEEGELEKIQEEVRARVGALQEQCAAVRAELQPYEECLSTLQAKADVTRTQHKLIADKHAAAKAQLESAQEAIQERHRAGEEKRTELGRLREALEQKRREIGEARTREQACAAKAGEAGAAADQLRSRLADVRETMSAAQSQGAVMSALIQAKANGTIPGIYGRLGDLGAIEARYDVAISTACPGLDWVVVDTTTTAQQCVELLRSQQLGVATFLILDKQQHLAAQAAERLATPEGIPRLYDLVKVADPALRPAFFFALRNTVVANDVEQGTRIAYGLDRRFRRVVTLNGELFESSGTMSGGGGKPRGGKMGTSVRSFGAAAAAAGSATGQAGESLADTAARLERELEAAAEGVARAQAEQRAAAKAAVDASRAVEKLEMAIPKIEMEIEALAGQAQELQRRIAQLQAAANPDPSELRQLQALQQQLQQEEAEVSKYGSSFAPLREKAQTLQKQIDTAGKLEIDTARKTIAKTKEDVSKVEKVMGQHRLALSSGQKTGARLRKSIEEAQEERERTAASLESKREELRKVEAEAFEVHEQFEKLSKEMDERKKAHDSEKKRYDELKVRVDKLRASEVDVQLKLEDAKKGLQSSVDAERGFSAKLKALDSQVRQMLAQLEAEGVTEEQQRVAMGPEPDPDHLTREEAQQQEALLTAQLKQLKPNLNAIAEYRKRQAAYEERVAEVEALTTERDEARRSHEELRKRRLDEFMAGFNVITTRLKEMYQMITLGGDAELELVDSLDPFSEGIVFSVRPPKKSWKNIANLSGGEKTLSSLALVFALHHYKPTPLYVMDEIDAALDFKNVSIVAHYIKDRTKNAQFIIISLRNNMFELADHLVGIYKTHNCTKSITIQPSSFVVAAAGNAAAAGEHPGAGKSAATGNQRDGSMDGDGGVTAC